MAKRKSAEHHDDAGNPGQGQEAQAETQSNGAADAGEATPAAKSTWLTRFGSWTDAQAGVHLIEDRQNRRMTIRFEERPSEAVRAVIKSEEHGFRFDGEEQVWWKRINPAKPVQAREEAEQLAFQVANMIRGEKGLEAKKSFAIGM